jgi:Glycosyltransferase family 87
LISTKLKKILLALLLAALVMKSSGLRSIAVDDFVEYWTAGRLLLAGQNPYSPSRIHDLEKVQGLQEPNPLMMWNPPWTLTLLIPLSFLSYEVSRIFWLYLNFGVVFLSANLLWKLYGGDPRLRAVPLVLTLSYFPTLLALRLGQISPLILFGVVGFLHCEKRGKMWLAGSVAVLISIKPQLVYLFWIALVLWAIRRHYWAVLVASGLTLLLFTLIPSVLNPNLIAQYVNAVVSAPPANVTPTVGALLRMMFGADRIWLQFLPTAIGLLWFISYWRNRSQKWNWIEQMPVLLLMSVLTTTYGWQFDLVVLLPAIVQSAVKLASLRSIAALKVGALLFLLMNLVALSLNLLAVKSVWFFWLPLCVFCGYLAINRDSCSSVVTPLGDSSPVVR